MLYKNIKAILKCSQKFYATIILYQTDVYSYVRISDWYASKNFIDKLFDCIQIICTLQVKKGNVL